MPSRLLLVGGGHSHLFVLEAFARQPLVGVTLALVAPAPLATYSGMIPGVLAGHYPLRAAQIDLRRLAARAGATLVAARAVAIDPQRRTIALDDGRDLAYDLLSFDIGAHAAAVAPASPGAPLVPIKPIDAAVAAIATALAARPAARAVVIGAGAGGCEVALALQARLRRGGGRVALCDRAARPLPGFAAAAVRRTERALAAAGVAWHGEAAAAALEDDGVRLADGAHLPAELIVTAAGVAAAPLFAAAGLAVDGRGFLLVDDALRCPAHPEIFAAGDCATMVSRPALPKAGVFAVRQGPVLAANLRAALTGAAPASYRPQTRTLALLNTADGRAILSYGVLAAQGRWVWRLKDAIDRRFVRRFDS